MTYLFSTKFEKNAFAFLKGSEIDSLSLVSIVAFVSVQLFFLRNCMTMPILAKLLEKITGIRVNKSYSCKGETKV
jgi:hypothetical protein